MQILFDLEEATKKGVIRWQKEAGSPVGRFPVVRIFGTSFQDISIKVLEKNWGQVAVKIAWAVVLEKGKEKKVWTTNPEMLAGEVPDDADSKSVIIRLFHAALLQILKTEHLEGSLRHSFQEIFPK